MSFTFDPTTDRGKVRLLVHDTTDGTYGTDYDFSDADIDAFLELNGDSVWLASAEACRSLAVKATATSYIIKLPGALELDREEVAKRYIQMADRFEQRATSSSDTVVEYFDSFDYGIDEIGQDIGEYVGDV